MSKNLKTSAVIIFSSLLISCVLIVLQKTTVFAQSSPINLQAEVRYDIDFFGGTITKTIPCTCSGSLYIEVADLVTNGTVKTMYVPIKSTLQEYYNPVPKAYTIGGFWKVKMSCEVTVTGGDCEVVAKADSIIDYQRGIGTSK